MYAEAAPSSTSTDDTSRVEYELNQGLIQFMHTTVPYTLKRLLPADLKTIYVGRGGNNVEVKPNPFQMDFQAEENNVKGGVRLTNNINYNW